MAAESCHKRLPLQKIVHNRHSLQCFLPQPSSVTSSGSRRIGCAGLSGFAWGHRLRCAVGPHAASTALGCRVSRAASTALGCRASRGRRSWWPIGPAGRHRFGRPGCCSPSAATASSSRRTLSAPGAPNTVPICRFWAGGFSHAGRKRHNGTRKSCRLESGIRMAWLQCDALLARCTGGKPSRQPSATKTPAAQRSRCPTQPRPDATDALATQRSRCAARPT